MIALPRATIIALTSHLIKHKYNRYEFTQASLLINTSLTHVVYQLRHIYCLPLHLRIIFILVCIAIETIDL